MSSFERTKTHVVKFDLAFSRFYRVTRVRVIQMSELTKVVKDWIQDLKSNSSHPGKFISYGIFTIDNGDDRIFNQIQQYVFPDSSSPADEEEMFSYMKDNEETWLEFLSKEIKHE
jgi:hypothetical protein